jgi:hypothetical protein
MSLMGLGVEAGGWRLEPGAGERNREAMPFQGAALLFSFHLMSLLFINKL